jgi:bacterioferritin
MNWRLGKLGVTAGKATMAQAVRYVAGFGAMAVLLAAAVLFVTIDGTVNRWIILMSSALVTMMIVVTLSCVFLMSSITRMQKFARIVSRLVNGIVKRVTFGRVKSVLTTTRVQEFLEGTPNMQRDDVEIGEDVVSCLKADLKLEYHLREKLAQGVKLCEEKGDYITRDMLRQQMSDTEEDHTYWLEKQLRLIELIGLQNYIQSQM